MKRTGCLLLSAVLLLCLCGCGSPESQAYRRGKDALSGGQYVEAAHAFGPLGDYRQSPEFLAQIQTEALAQYNEGNYGAAAPIFEALAQYDAPDARIYAQLSRAYACLDALDGSGARESLSDADPADQRVADALVRLDEYLFPGTPLFRPEAVVEDLKSGRLTPEVTNISQDPYTDAYCYAMTRNQTQRAYDQYRSYCISAFPDSFQEESENYFSFLLQGSTCYVSNFYSTDGGLVIKIPRY